MQGPKLNIITECKDCQFLGATIICNKLNVSLELKNGLINPHKSCPFLEENAIKFHNEAISKITKNKETKIKNIIDEIFPDCELRLFSVNEIILATETITNDHIVKIQKEFPDYLYEIYVDDYMNLKLSLTKLVKV